MHNVKNIIIGGDVNALHLVWDDKNRVNKRGKIICDILLKSQFHILNNGKATRQSIDQRSDVQLMSHMFHQIYHWTLIGRCYRIM